MGEKGSERQRRREERHSANRRFGNSVSPAACPQQPSLDRNAALRRLEERARSGQQPQRRQAEREAWMPCGTWALSSANEDSMSELHLCAKAASCQCFAPHPACFTDAV